MTLRYPMKFRTKTAYWGNYFTKAEVIKEGISEKDLEVYNEEDHGWHNSEEFKNGKLSPYNIKDFNACVFELYNKYGDDVNKIKVEYNKKYKDNLNDTDIKVCLKKHFRAIVDNQVRYFTSKKGLNNYIDLKQVS